MTVILPTSMDRLSILEQVLVQSQKIIILALFFLESSTQTLLIYMIIVLTNLQAASTMYLVSQ